MQRQVLKETTYFILADPFSTLRDSQRLKNRPLGVAHNSNLFLPNPPPPPGEGTLEREKFSKGIERQKSLEEALCQRSLPQDDASK